MDLLRGTRSENGATTDGWGMHVGTRVEEGGDGVEGSLVGFVSGGEDVGLFVWW